MSATSQEISDTADRAAKLANDLLIVYLIDDKDIGNLRLTWQFD